MGQYLPVFALLVLATLFGAISLVMARVANPPKPTAAKVMPYESGITDITDQPERFPVRFFLIAMIFIVFDIEIIFFYPFTMVYRELGAFGFFAILIFAAAVFESFLYLISSGALDWGPVRQARQSLLRSSARTAESTVRRVGADGRAAAPAVADTETAGVA